MKIDISTIIDNKFKIFNIALTLILNFRNLRVKNHVNTAS